jgi:hypothetical protein
MEKWKLTDEQVGLIKSWTAITDNNGQQWFFMPCWFKEISNNIFEVHKLGNLPDELVNHINNIRKVVSESNSSFDNNEQQ